MANLKDVRTVPELESLTGEEKVLVNVDGSVAQARVDLIKPKTGKELMYEWNFSADDDVYYIEENVSEDISWLANPAEDSHFEIVASSYAFGWDDDMEEEIVLPEKILTCYINYLRADVSLGDGFGIYNGPYMCISAYCERTEYETNCRYYSGVDIYVYHGIHYNSSDDAYTGVDIGGNIFIEAYGGPFKSIKIYKVTK